MNRRQFLTYTIALAAAAPLAKLSVVSAGPATMSITPPLPAAAPLWVPSQAEVDEWLVYYKICVQQGVTGFHDVINRVYVDQPPDETLEMYREAERAFDRLESDRMAVAISQGAGYAAGRDGLPRECPQYMGPSNEAFGWYNMWAIGDRDRRGIRLPRSPGVTWPDGRRPSYLDRFR